MLSKIAEFLIGRAERRIGVALDYTRKIAQTDFWLLSRYNRIFGFLDPNQKVPPDAYHTARLRGAIAADCGSCVTAEVNLARQAGLSAALIDQVLHATYDQLPAAIRATAQLSDAVAGRREDHPEARATIIESYGEAGLIELSFAMNGAAVLPGIKRAMGYATQCDLSVIARMQN